jgi:DNA-binding IscR family transcriptional regulator
VDAGLLLRKKEKNVTGYKLARLPEEILLVDIHKAFNKKWHQEFSSIELFLAECLGEKTLADLCRYEEVEMKDILLRKLVL